MEQRVAESGETELTAEEQERAKEALVESVIEALCKAGRKKLEVTKELLDKFEDPNKGPEVPKTLKKFPIGVLEAMRTLFEKLAKD
ncbi:hypothetical protein [Shimazuella kribbensis]|uniref:hypothetical protein n=1 Tax=Shimazuella kribbensis TaxID=139808 RepID=UPI000405E19F|nr:hypothetical protein [Shimazuella kribbensis]